MKLLRRLLSFFASYGLATVLLLLLMALVFFGTIEQTRLGVYEAQRRYFESLFVVHWLFGRVPLPLPGGYLLLALVFVNMACGAVLAAPKRLTRPGLLIAHCGVLFLIAAGFMTHHYSISGNMVLHEGETGSRFQSYHDWEIRIAEVGAGSKGRQFIIPQADFEGLGEGDHQLFQAEDLPFDLRIVRYAAHCEPAPGTGPWAVDGVELAPQPQLKTAEYNVPGAFVTLHWPDNLSQSGLLWGQEFAPWRVTAGDKEYALSLTRREWVLPFSLTLKTFNHQTHPGTGIPSHFSSDITLVEGGAPRETVIRMNEPLRHRGYTFYQASWGPSDAAPGTPLYSVLAVNRNPAGQWPLYASCVISLGLLLHFSQTLWRYLRRQAAQSKTPNGGSQS